MKRTAATLALLLCTAHAQARTLYVSLTGSHDTNATAFSTWATAATNIQAAIDAASDGDTVRVGPGTYYGQVTINKSELTVQGMRGTLFDADRTVIDRQGAAFSTGVAFSGATNSTLRGFTIMGAAGVGVYFFSGASNTVDSCVVRHCTGSQGVSLQSWGTLRNSIIVGGSYGGTYPAGVLHAEPGGGLMENCIVEANSTLQIATWGVSYGLLRSRNNIHGNVGGLGLARYTDLGGNLTSSTTNSVMQALGIAPASEGVGTNLVWKGVSAYIPRLGSLARMKGQLYGGIETAFDGAGGPALTTTRPFIGRDSSTNFNHGVPIGGVTESTNSPFAGSGGSALNLGGGLIVSPILIDTSAPFTLECWVYTTSRMNWLGFGNNEFDGATYRRAFVGIRGGNYWIGVGGTQIYTVPATAIESNSWSHIALVHSNKVAKYYVNGSPVQTNAVVPNGQQVTFGHGISASGVNVAGVASALNPHNTADVRVWNIARTQAEIAAAYTNRLTGTEEGLVGYWPLTGTTSPIDTGPFNLDNPIIHPTYMEAF